MHAPYSACWLLIHIYGRIYGPSVSSGMLCCEPKLRNFIALRTLSYLYCVLCTMDLLTCVFAEVYLTRGSLAESGIDVIGSD